MPRDVFAIWLEYGEKPGRAYGPYRALRDQIMQATATARLKAESGARWSSRS